MVGSFKNQFSENVTNIVMESKNNYSQSLASLIDELRYSSSSDEFYKMCLDATIGGFKGTAYQMVGGVLRCLKSEEAVNNERAVKINDSVYGVRVSMFSLLKGMKKCPLDSNILSCTLTQVSFFSSFGAL